ncbi:uncharacterized protein TNCV_3873791 [Trichonephila clavipes]|nr:uncharacterized protein TNCV_3873791 [Trichonephila clavipes]
MTLPQSDTVQLPCSRHHFNRAPLDWTDRGTQTRGTRAYSPFICNLRLTVTADIALPMDAVTLDVLRVEVSLRFRLATIAIYRFSRGFRRRRIDEADVSTPLVVDQHAAKCLEEAERSFTAMRCRCRTSPSDVTLCCSLPVFSSCSVLVGPLHQNSLYCENVPLHMSSYCSLGKPSLSRILNPPPFKLRSLL